MLETQIKCHGQGACTKLTQAFNLIDKSWNSIILKRRGANEELFKVDHLRNPLVTCVAFSEQKEIVKEIDNFDRLGKKLHFRCKDSKHFVFIQFNLFRERVAARDTIPSTVAGVTQPTIG